jgi:hypothetical protein
MAQSVINSFLCSSIHRVDFLRTYTLLCLLDHAVEPLRFRLLDMGLVEHVKFLWIMEGEVYLRCHGGTAYMYHDGSTRSQRKTQSANQTALRDRLSLLGAIGCPCSLPCVRDAAIESMEGLAHSTDAMPEWT